MKYTGYILNNAIPDQKLKPKILSHFTMFAIINEILISKNCQISKKSIHKTTLKYLLVFFTK